MRGTLNITLMALLLSGCASIEALQKRAEAGDPDAMFQLAKHHLRGSRLVKNEQKGVILLEEAARSGHPEAMRAFAVCLEHGVGVQQDCPKAADWYWKSARAGNHNSLLALIDIYIDGRAGIPQNLPLAQELLAIADTALQAQQNTHAVPGDANNSLKPNAYGLGIHMNRYGQPVKLAPKWGAVPGEVLRIKPDAYGPGVHSDQYGRPVHERPAFGQ